MRVLVVSILVILGARPLAAQDAAPPTPPAANVEIKSAPAVITPGTRQFALTSKKNGREYRIFVGEPKGEAPPNGFPVIYCLDGNATFGTLYDSARRASRTLGPMVVVGIGYPTDESIDSTRRSYDFIQNATEEFIANLPRRGEWKTGGQAEFIEFIEGDLKPLIEKTYTINRRKQTLIGHSFGGLFALHVLFNKPESFQSYVAISPSIWWADMTLLEEERKFIEAKGKRADLLIAVGGREKEHMIDDAKDMAGRLKEKLSSYGLRVVYKELPEEDHGSVVAGAISAALRFAEGAGPR